MFELGIDKQRLTLRMNFDDLSKGIAKVVGYFQGNYPSHTHTPQLSKALEVSTRELNQIIESDWFAVIKTQVEEKRNLFTPYLSAMMEKRVPATLSIGCLTDELRYIKLPSGFETLGDDEQHKMAKKLIRAHYIESGGHIASFGKITHYAMQIEYEQPIDEILIFDVTGVLIQTPDSTYERIPASRLGLLGIMN